MFNTTRSNSTDNAAKVIGIFVVIVVMLFSIATFYSLAATLSVERAIKYLEDNGYTVFADGENPIPTLVTPGLPGDSIRDNSPSGLEIIGNALTFLRGCEDLEFMQWSEIDGHWNCSNSLTNPELLSPEVEKFISHSTDFGLIAYNGQVQGGLVLSAEMNEISTVTNPLDSVTLPQGIEGESIEIINSGDNNLVIFPSIGETIARGINLPYILAPNEVVRFICYSIGKWITSASTDILHGHMYDEGNLSPYIISEQLQRHVYHSSGLTAEHLLDWEFDSGGFGSNLSILTIVDGGSGTIDITTSVDHDLEVDDIVSISGSSDINYNNVFVIEDIVDLDTFTVSATFGTTDIGVVNQAAVLIAGVGSSGQYSLTWSISSVADSKGEIVDFDVYINGDREPGAGSREDFNEKGSIESVSGTDIVDIIEGDRLSFVLTNISSNTDILIRDISLVLIRL